MVAKFQKMSSSSRLCGLAETEPEWVENVQPKESRSVIW